ncbi:unnamed protein product [Rhodiola kirilowii]
MFIWCFLTETSLVASGDAHLPCSTMPDYMQSGRREKIGVVSGKAIFGPPLEEYWKNKLQEDAAVAVEKKTDASPSSS